MGLAETKIVIIGGGLAGAAAGYGLVCRGARSVTVLEGEPTCGYHASGRNAAMIRQVTASRPITLLAREGAEFFRAPSSSFEVAPYFRRTGSLLLATGESLDRLRRQAAEAESCGVSLEFWTHRRTVDLIPLLEGASFEEAVWSPDDGVIDLHALLEGFLFAIRRSGGRVWTGTAVTGFRVRQGLVEAVETSAGSFRADIVVNAAGAWAGQIAALAGASALPLRPCRRHLMATGPISGIDPKWPFVWDLAHEFYFRPESGGLLMSPCDEEEFTPCDAHADPAASLLLADKLERFAPRLLEFPVVNSWAGLRTLTPDGRFVVGPDPWMENFFWVAGLGGHGVTTSPALGRLAAQAIEGRIPEGAEAFSPGRFTGGNPA